MKIAVVGKWGSGKSTISSLILAYLAHKHKQFWAIDADTNMHLGLNFHIAYETSKALSNETTVREIKTYLIWKNKRIDSVDHMVKTTPPGPWSTIIRKPHDDFIQQYSIWQVGNWALFFVWWYTAEWAGISCYHTSLAILENILSHINFWTDEYLVVDMVASTDTFSNSLYLQFDAIILLVEPTKESVDLAIKYIKLAKDVCVQDSIYIFGNKIVDEDDIKFIQDSLWCKQFPYVPYDNELKKQLRNGKSILDYFTLKQNILAKTFSFLEDIPLIPFKTKLQKLATLHKKYAQLDYIKTPLWDISNQVDKKFINTQ